ncbi:uncharacterized protein LOC123713627 [Pieris brassicae]|uniref:uncharacterized protein LOC123713627 n=1 Tax=Pieris brassicae TaxID=7116 RepID=UPI001E65FABD|nr:uncharacterized protein LOC123713627 [Pieris brassicae]
MEAAQKLKHKKPISKTKLKKTIKNIVCRPDPINWLLASTEEHLRLETTLQKYRVTLPEFKKPHWNDIKDLPKEKRPRPPPCKRVEGLIFGLSECRESLKNGLCSGILIDADVNPKMLVEPIIEDCCSNLIPFLCLNGLRKTSAVNFGISTCCLGIQKGCLLDIQNDVQIIFNQKYKPEVKNIVDNEKEITETPMIVDSEKEIKIYPYLYRKSKKERVFKPSEYTAAQTVTEKFTGQNFIGISENKKNDSKSYMNMILKRMSNNPNRVKLKKKYIFDT